jgi:hypothetical protein
MSSDEHPTRPADSDDALLRALGELPTHEASAASDRRIREVAREAFVDAFDDAPWYAKLFKRHSAGANGTPAMVSVGGGVVGRAAVPVVLAAVVGLYLFWAFAVAIAINK